MTRIIEPTLACSGEVVRTSARRDTFLTFGRRVAHVVRGLAQAAERRPRSKVSFEVVEQLRRVALLSRGGAGPYLQVDTTTSIERLGEQNSSSLVPDLVPAAHAAQLFAVHAVHAGQSDLGAATKALIRRGVRHLVEVHQHVARLGAVDAGLRIGAHGVLERLHEPLNGPGV